MKLRIDCTQEPCQMILLKDMNCQLCPEGNKKETACNKYKKIIE
jgi:hypothetical protein